MFEQDAWLSTEAAADHDGRRGRQPERVRARDHHHGDREQQRVTDRASDDKPDDEGQSAADECDQYQPERGAICKLLSRGLRVLRFLDEFDDLRERGVGSDLGGSDSKGAVSVDRGTDHRGARLLVHRQALAGHHRFVDFALAFFNDPVDRDLGARPYEQPIADNDVGRRNFDGFVATQHHGHRWCQIEE